MNPLQSFITPICLFKFSEDKQRALIQRLLGTSFFLGNKGHFMTAKHVMNDALSISLKNNEFIGLCIKTDNEFKESGASIIINWEGAPSPNDIAIGLISESGLIDTPIHRNDTLINVLQDVHTYGYPLSTSINKNDFWGIGLRSNKGYIQRIIGDGTLPSEEPPLRYETNFLIGQGMSGSPLLTDNFNLIGICTGSSRSEIIEDQIEEINENGRIYIETKSKIEQHGISESVEPLLNWKADLFQGKTLQQILAKAPKA